jgi:hypothetical protein
MGISSHPGADALQETVVSNLPARDGLIIGVPGWLREAGQQSLDQRIDEREQRLLCQPEAADLTVNAFQTRGEFFLRCKAPLSRPTSSRSIAVRINAVGLEKPASLAACSIRSIIKPSIRKPRETVLLLTGVFTTRKPRQVRCVTGACTTVHISRKLVPTVTALITST